MFEAATLQGDRANRSQAINLIIFFLSPLVTSAVPKLTWLFLLLLAIALTVPALRRDAEWRRSIQPTAALTSFSLVALYLFLNATWAAAHDAAFGKAALFLGLVIIVFAADRAIVQFEKPLVDRAALAFAAGALLGALFNSFELLTDGAISRMAMNSLTLLQSHNLKHVTISQGEITKLNLSDFNRNIAILAFNLWPALLVFRILEDRAWRVGLTALFFVAVAVPIFISEHQSSQVALIGSLAVFFLAWNWPNAVIKALAGLWCVAFVLVVPISLLAYKADLYAALWMPSSFRERVVIWDHTAELVLEHPWLGIGARSTRVLKGSNESFEQPADSLPPRTTGWHAHNLFLQTWYELGVGGVILIGLAGAIVALRMSLFPAVAQPFAAAAFTIFLAIAAFSWDMWQTWLMCAVGLMLLYLQTAAKAVGSPRRSTASKHEQRRDKTAPPPAANVRLAAGDLVRKLAGKKIAGMERDLAREIRQSARGSREPRYG